MDKSLAPEACRGEASGPEKGSTNQVRIVLLVLHFQWSRIECVVLPVTGGHEMHSSADCVLADVPFRCQSLQ